MDVATFPSLLVALLLGAVLGGLLLWLWGRGRTAALLERLRWSEGERQRGEAAAAEVERLRLELARRDAEREADAERLAWIHTAEEQLRSDFRALAGELVQKSSRELAERSREQLEGVLSTARRDWEGQRQELRHLVEPVGESLDALGGQVRQLEKERQGAYEGLKQEIHLLRDAHRQLRTTAFGLERALKSPAVRGRWGEVQLRRVVEMAGMVEHVDFSEQPTIDGQRPDMIVHLPHRGLLPVDAKTPMNAYLDSVEAADEGERRRHLEAHSKALRQRTAELGQRRYWEQLPGSPDFVVMFIPNEASLGGAFEHDPDFLDYALRHRVLPATPVTLLALLKSVSYGWQQLKVTENARQIATTGRELHERLLRFLDHLRRLGKGLDGAREAYNQAVGSLERRVLPAARRLEETGASVEEAEPLAPLHDEVRPVGTPELHSPGRRQAGDDTRQAR